MRETTEILRNVVDFRLRRDANNWCTAQDKRDVDRFRDLAEVVGYASLKILETDVNDSSGGGDFVAAYRAGEAWSTWGFARKGAVVCAWSALTSNDAGTFTTMAEALKYVLLGTVQVESVEQSSAEASLGP